MEWFDDAVWVRMWSCLVSDADLDAVFCASARVTRALWVGVRGSGNVGVRYLNHCTLCNLYGCCIVFCYLTMNYSALNVFLSSFTASQSGRFKMFHLLFSLGNNCSFYQSCDTHQRKLWMLVQNCGTTTTTGSYSTFLCKWGLGRILCYQSKRPVMVGGGNFSTWWCNLHTERPAGPGSTRTFRTWAAIMNMFMVKLSSKAGQTCDFKGMCNNCSKSTSENSFRWNFRNNPSPVLTLMTPVGRLS